MAQTIVEHSDFRSPCCESRVSIVLVQARSDIEQLVWQCNWCGTMHVLVVRDDRTAYTPRLTATMRTRFEAAARETYNAIGSDVWGRDATDEDEFVDVIRDQIGNGHNDLTDDEIERFRSLPLSVKRSIILTAM